MMPGKNIGRRDFIKLTGALLATLTVSGFVEKGFSYAGSELKISPAMAKSISSLAQMIKGDLGAGATEIVNNCKIESLNDQSIDLATLGNGINKSIAWDYDNNKVCNVNGIVMAHTEVAVVLKLDKII
ncbi:MAG: hypothetical protein QM496_15235 [Verrucomicrobiota bacterium]